MKGGFNVIYQPRNVQPSSTSIDVSKDNIFKMEMQTNSYVDAYQLSISDFNNNTVYETSKIKLDEYKYNGDILSIPVKAGLEPIDGFVSLSNGQDYKWRVKLYQPNADIIITYGMIQAESTDTNIYLQQNINIRSGMILRVGAESNTILSYNVNTGLAIVDSAFRRVPTVGTQYYVYSDFIETIPDYIVYARAFPTVSILDMPDEITLKYHTFKGSYVQSNGVPIVYHVFDLYVYNDDGSMTLIDSSDKIYSANLTYSYDAFRTGKTYAIKMTIENDMGIMSETPLYNFNVNYAIVEYLQQPVAKLDEKQNAMKVSWVTPVENEATSSKTTDVFGEVLNGENSVSNVTIDPNKSIANGDVIQITANSVGKNIFNGVYKGVNIDSGKVIVGNGLSRTAVVSVEGNQYYSIQKYSYSNKMTIGITSEMYAENVDIEILNFDNTKANYTVRTKSDTKFILVEVSDDGITSELKIEKFDRSDQKVIDVIKGNTTQNMDVPPSPSNPSKIKGNKGIINLYDKDIPKEPYYYDNNGVKVLGNDDIYINQKVYIGYNDAFSFSFAKNNGGYIRFCEYDKNGNFIKRTLIQNITEGFTLDRNTNNVVFSVDADKFTDLQIEQYDKINVYVPYGDNYLVDERGNLISLQGDELNSLDVNATDILNEFSTYSLVEHKIRKYVFTGDETWKDNNGMGFYCDGLQDLLKNNVGTQLCSHFTYGSFDWEPGNKFGCISSSGNMWVTPDNSFEDDAEAFQQWVKEQYNYNTPLTILYCIPGHDENVIAGCTAYEPYRPIGTKFTGATKSFNSDTGVITTLDDNKFQYSPIPGDVFQVVSNIYSSLGGERYLYNTPFNGVNSLYTHGYTSTWHSDDGLLVIPEQKNITMQFSVDNNFYYDIDGLYDAIRPIIETESDNESNIDSFDIYLDESSIVYMTPHIINNSLDIFTINSAPTGSSNTRDYIYLDKNIDVSLTPYVTFIGKNCTERIVEFDSSTRKATFQRALPFEPNVGDKMYTNDSMSKMLYINENNKPILTINGVPQLNIDYIWDDEAIWNDTYYWTEGGTCLEKICGHWWKVQITNTEIKAEEIYPSV